MTDEEMLARAVAEARQGLAEGGIPIGAVLVHDGKVLGGGHNRRVQQGSAIRHGETDCLENIGRLPAQRLRRARRWSPPCRRATCAPARSCSTASRASWSGRTATSSVASRLLASRGVEVVVLDDAECVEMMASFIAENPTLWNEDIGVEDEAAAPAGS